MLNIVNNRTIVVPKGIRFISDWTEYSLKLFKEPHILDKKIPGCGYTEYCLRCDFNVLLCSPRKLLLENKENQHPGEIYYFQSIYNTDPNETFDQDLTLDVSKLRPKAFKQLDETEIQERLKVAETRLQEYIDRRVSQLKPLKIIVTYDSYRLVKEYLVKMGIFQSFYVVIDEFQSIFTDSRFKSNTEMEFVYHLMDVQKLCFVSATPMIDSYLKQIDEFKDLPYYELDWYTEEPGRISKPDLEVFPLKSKSINEKACDIIESYKLGKYDYKDFWESGELRRIYSKEAVFFINSVNNITSIIKKSGLQPEECNILCSNTPDNAKKIKTKLGKQFLIGSVPLRGEPHKMFTFCTRTVYLGADFYSDNARSFVFSDANIQSLAVDISLDLPQILGRQRLQTNPWRNTAEFYYKLTSLKNTKEDYDKFIQEKIKNTEEHLDAYKKSSYSSLLESYRYLAVALKYRMNYVSVNCHAGTNKIPVFNKLVLISEQRAFDIQQIDYKDRFSVFTSMTSSLGVFEESENPEIVSFLGKFNSFTNGDDKVRLLCDLDGYPGSDISFILCHIPNLYRNIYEQLGSDRIKSQSYNFSRIKKEYENLFIKSSEETDISKTIIGLFSIGQTYTKSSIKSTIQGVYDKFGIRQTAKANELERYFNLRETRILDKTTGKKDAGYKLLGYK